MLALTLDRAARRPPGVGDVGVEPVRLGQAVVGATLRLGGLAGMHFHRKVDKAGLGR